MHHFCHATPARGQSLKVSLWGPIDWHIRAWFLSVNRLHLHRQRRWQRGQRRSGRQGRNELQHPDLLGAFTSNGHNLIGLDDGNTGLTDGVLGDIVGSGTPVSPLVGPLTNNGGLTFTCALSAESPALDTGDDTLFEAPSGLTTDQRGLPLKSGSHVDIGAVEFQWASNPIRLAACTRTMNGAVQVTLTNVPGASLTMLAATNPSLPLSSWTVLGPITEFDPGQFQFVEAAPTNLPQRIYRVRCP